MNKAVWSIIAASTGAGAFAAWLFAIWSDHQGKEWLATAVLLTFTAWATGMLASDQ